MSADDLPPDVPPVPPNSAGGLWVWNGSAMEPAPTPAADPLPSDDE